MNKIYCAMGVLRTTRLEKRRTGHMYPVETLFPWHVHLPPEPTRKQVPALDQPRT